MSSKQSGEMVEGNSTDTCAGKFQLMSMGGLVGVLREQTRDPHRLEWNSYHFVSAVEKTFLCALKRVALMNKNHPFCS